MSSIDTSTSTPKTDSYDNGAPRAADPTTALSDQERATLTKILANPLDFPQEFPGWLDDFVRLRLTASSIAGLQAAIWDAAFPIGDWRIISEDLTANTSEYVWTDPITGLEFLYGNGAAVSQTTYAALYAQWGASKYAADSGGNFTIPDTRGRPPWMAGTNAALDLGDNDGVAEASRQPKHTHSDTLAISGTPSFTDPGHTHSVPRGSSTVIAGSGASNAADTAGATTGSSTTGASVGKGTLALSGSVGTGMAGSDATAHIVIGSLVVRF